MPRPKGQRIEELLPVVAKGDVRRGHAVFYSAKASCSSCHRMGYAGGTTGPELSHVGQTRTERDLLESILFPSLSFVRSYEPMLITTQDGKSINGIIKEESAQGVRGRDGAGPSRAIAACGGRRHSAEQDLDHASGAG